MLCFEPGRSTYAVMNCPDCGRPILVVEFVRKEGQPPEDPFQCTLVFHLAEAQKVGLNLIETACAAAYSHTIADYAQREWEMPLERIALLQRDMVARVREVLNS